MERSLGTSYSGGQAGWRADPGLDDVRAWTGTWVSHQHWPQERLSCHYVNHLNHNPFHTRISRIGEWDCVLCFLEAGDKAENPFRLWEIVLKYLGLLPQAESPYHLTSHNFLGWQWIFLVISLKIRVLTVQAVAGGEGDKGSGWNLRQTLFYLFYFPLFTRCLITSFSCDLLLTQIEVIPKKKKIYLWGILLSSS